MKFRLKRKSVLPLHVQLKAQLAHMIQTGQWTRGTRLPTVRQLAVVLRINRNTVSKVFAELERGGYLSCEPGRGTFVSPRKSAGKGEKLRELLAMMDEATRRARQLGFAPTEFAASLYARSTSGRAIGVSKIPVLFLECSRPKLRRLSGQLAAALPARVDARLIKDLHRMVRRSPASLRRYALVVTTFFHVYEVKKLLAKTTVEVVGLSAQASQETLMRLAALPEGTRVGVTEQMKLSIRNTGLTHIRLVPCSGHNTPAVRRMLRQASVVVCSSPLAKKLRAAAAKGTGILLDDLRLDRAGIEMIRQKLWERMARDGGPRGIRARAWRS